jgi:hypothetical protein
MRKAAAIFSLFCGLAMLMTWGILLGTGRVPELETTPLEAGFLLAAEFLTAFSLLLGGFGLLSGRSWGFNMDLAALGMLLYCTVYSVGVFSQGRNMPATGFFVVIALLAGLFSASFIVASREGRSS